MVKGHKGFSLVELVCTIAIFSIIVTGVGTAMVVSARSYQSGNVELDLQQQAQITSNLLTNLIIDSDNVVQASGGTLEVNKLESGVIVTYTISYDGSDKIYYTTSSDPAGGPRVLAEHVTGFTVSQDIGGNVDFRLEFNENGRNYKSDYHVTPRNGISSGGAVTSGTASIFVENRLILEPGQEYDLNVRVMGTSIQGFTIENLSGCTDLTGTTVQAQDTSTARIKVGLGETSSSFYFEVKALDGSIAPQLVTVLVRRVNAINVNGYKVDGVVNKVGAVYKVTAPLAGTNLEKEPGAWFDVDYVNPYTVDWALEFVREDEYGNRVMPPVGDYIEEVGRGVDGNVPYIMLKLKQNMTQGCSLKVTATALHPEGEVPVGSGNKTNKSSRKYGTVQGSWVLNYQAWRRNGKLDITVPLTERDFWLYDNGTSLYKYEASVSFTGYNKLGMQTENQTFNPWTPSQNALLNVEVPEMAHIDQIWNLILNVATDSGDIYGFYDKASYSTPYHAAKVVDEWKDNGRVPSSTNGYCWRYSITSSYNWRDTSLYEVKITYQHQLEDGTVETTVIEETYAIEDVAILYRNSNSANWVRDNKIYVTPQDTKTEYTVFFKFDQGWDDTDTDYYFHDLTRFVGLIHDDADYTKDVRYDIPISPSIPTGPGQYAGASYLTFVMSPAEKQECLDMARPYGGVVQEIFEYNPYLGKLNMDIREGEAFWTWDETQWADPSNFVAKAEPYANYNVTQAQVDMMKGCKGTLQFCFKDPNITVAGSVTPTIMYCPTLSEYGPVYYIDDATRFVIGATMAEYQVLEGGTWVTKSNMMWDAANNGWIAN